MNFDYFGLVAYNLDSGSELAGYYKVRWDSDRFGIFYSPKSD